MIYMRLRINIFVQREYFAFGTFEFTSCLLKIVVIIIVIISFFLTHT